MFDWDEVYTEEELRCLQSFCERKGYELYMSNPCFEVWLMLHFRNPVLADRAESMKDEMSKVLGRKYVESEGINPDDEMVERAIAEAGRRFGDLDVMGCFGRSRSTMVHELVRTFHG